MTFRTRLVLAATAAVLIVVVLGSIATYVVAYNSLVGSVDVSLSGEAHAYAQSTAQTVANGCSTTTIGDCIQITFSNGSVGAPLVLPVNNTVKSVAASQGKANDAFFSSTLDNTAIRQVVTALPPGFLYNDGTGYRQLAAGGALQITTPLTGVNHELHNLAIALWLIVLAGVTIAVVLGLAVGRTVLRPLNSLTHNIEYLAETTDVSSRLDPGGPDELGRLRRAFNQLLNALDTSRESQRQLVLDASHELRTPLTSLRTNMEVARRMDELAPEEREVLIGDVLTQLDELTTLVGDLAELARGEHPRPISEPTRLDTIVLDAVEIATTHGRSRGVVFDTSVAPTWVSGSPPRISRAVDNLLDNALKWSHDGGVVEVSCTGGVVVVRDHGPGVDESDAEHIFDRFYRAPSARGRPGSGLGLAIVAQVARDEGGSVTVHRANGGGALFRFTLPEVDSPSASNGPTRK
jgi:two-component system sensor histidine kinase MprB